MIPIWALMAGGGLLGATTAHDKNKAVHAQNMAEAEKTRYSPLTKSDQGKLNFDYTSSLGAAAKGALAAYALGKTLGPPEELDPKAWAKVGSPESVIAETSSLGGADSGFLKALERHQIKHDALAGIDGMAGNSGGIWGRMIG